MECDPSCTDLAEFWLSNEPYTSRSIVQHERRVKDLAEAIQSTVESWLESYPLRPQEDADREDEA